MQEIKTLSTYKQSLRSSILETAMSAFSKRGVRAVKMDDIAKQLGISKRTLYEIYDTKEKLLFEGVCKYKAMKDAEERQFAENSRNVIDYILKIYRKKAEEDRDTNPSFYSDISKYPRIVAYLQHDKEERRHLFLEFMQRGMDEGFFRSDINYQLIAYLLDAMGAYMAKKGLYRQYSFKELFFNLLLVTLRGICTKKGIEELDSSMERLDIFAESDKP